MSTVRAKYGRMVHDTSVVPIRHHSRSVFDKPNDTLLTMVPDLLIPVWRKYAYPGDTLKLSISSLLRLTTQKVPFFTPVVMDVHVWSVPIRQVWSHFLNMQGQKDTPNDSTDYLVPIINSGESGFEFGSIHDYFWNVPGVANYDITSLFHRSYTHTWNTRYRDENIQEPIDFPLGDEDDASNYTLLPRGKRKMDYISSRLPWPQKGEDVLLPLGESAAVVGNGFALGLTDGNLLGGANYSTNGSWHMNASVGNFGKVIGTAVSGATVLGDGESFGVPTREQLGSDPSGSGLIADLSTATSATMSQLYVANAIQQMLQLDAQAGTRYDEAILARWGVKPTSYRVSAYPEFLGGGTFDLNLQVVPQTSSTNTTSPQASLASFGVINGYTKEIVKTFDEHCCVFAVASIRPGKYYYQYGIDRDMTKRARTDFYEPILANLPEQGILKQEIFVQPKTVLNTAGRPDNESIVGYGERWVEDKVSLNHICGHMRSNSPLSLDIWHLADDYDESFTALNSSTIVENLTDSLNRVLAVDESDTTPPFYGQFVFKETWIKEMPVYNNASFLMF